MTEKKTPQQPVQPPKTTEPVRLPPPKKYPGRDTDPKPERHVEPSEPWPRKKK